MAAGSAADKVIGLPDGQDNPEFQIHSPRLALRTGNRAHGVGDIRLCPEVKLHIGVDRKVVPTFLADPFALSVSLKGAWIDPKLIGLADGAANG